jgi:hypothetical protein
VILLHTSFQNSWNPLYWSWSGSTSVVGGSENLSSSEFNNYFEHRISLNYYLESIELSHGFNSWTLQYLPYEAFSLSNPGEFYSHPIISTLIISQDPAILIMESKCYQLGLFLAKESGLFPLHNVIIVCSRTDLYVSMKLLKRLPRSMWSKYWWNFLSLICGFCRNCKEKV